MTGHKFPEAHQLILLVEKAPFSETEKSRLVELLNANGMTDETTEEVHKALFNLPKESYKSEVIRAKFNMDLVKLLKQWRMSQGSKKFKHARQ